MRSRWTHTHPLSSRRLSTVTPASHTTISSGMKGSARNPRTDPSMPASDRNSAGRRRSTESSLARSAGDGDDNVPSVPEADGFLAERVELLHRR